MKSDRPNEPPLPEPLGYLLTWRTHGSWLPGDQRGWVRKAGGDQAPDEQRHRAAARAMNAEEVRLNSQQRIIAEQAIRDHCQFRNWQLFAVNCRSNHVHAVVSADLHPKEVLRQLKAWATRRLNEADSPQDAWWAEKGSIRYLNSEAALEGGIVYVRDAQDRK
ncbi:transposase [Blastopirellula marina]|uniref:Transposase IS200-like domain-containing protein n=1 Tax=Blastopirellula marina TaxID=124 RepID=A0A2S8GSY8_9BACT|nr:transposase [Blastopirellula marina]PQO47491.1 hypothetical protein C5Y93_05470 [Blastopirellula marina]